MFRLTPLFAALCLMVACSPEAKPAGAGKKEMASLVKKVNALEKRVKALEAFARGDKPKGDGAKAAKAGKGAKGAKAGNGAKAGKGGKDGEKGPKVSVTVEGDAARVALAFQGKRFAVPGDIPVGSYQVAANFGEDKAVNAGKVELTEDGPSTLTCSSATKTCTLE
ncbi:MAG: hypothetical protein ACON5B_13770 [Myxococcota bacterium]